MPQYKYQKRLSAIQAKEAVKRLLKDGWTMESIKQAMKAKSITTVYNWINGKCTAPMTLKTLAKEKNHA